MDVYRDMNSIEPYLARVMIFPTYNTEWLTLMSAEISQMASRR